MKTETIHTTDLMIHKLTEEQYLRAKEEGKLDESTANLYLTTPSASAITELAVDGQVITYTKSDGTIGTITTQDTNTDTDTTYSAGAGLSLSETTFVNTGVRSVNTGTANGTISVNTNGIDADVPVKGLGSAAYTDSSTYAAVSHGNHVPNTQKADNSKFLRNDNSWQKVTPENIGAAAASHGNHVPTPETANNAKFLRNDNTWQIVTPENIGAATANHGTHVSYGTSVSALGTASAGSANTVSRSDHTHSLPALDLCSGTLAVSKGGTGATTAEGARDNLGITRLFASMAPFGTGINENSDLNTINFLKVGNYYCSGDTTAATLANCPTGRAFMMQVYTPLKARIDNETTDAWVYRVRKIITYRGEEYTQIASSGETPGAFTYGPWSRIATNINLLTADVDYGITFPTGAKQGQIFYKKVGS